MFTCSYAHYHFLFFFFNDTATTEIYTLSPTRRSSDLFLSGLLPAAYGYASQSTSSPRALASAIMASTRAALPQLSIDRKSTRLNSSHGYISYAVFCLKKKYRSLLDILC